MPRRQGRLPRHGKECARAVDEAARRRMVSIDGCTPPCGEQRAWQQEELFFGGGDLLLLLLDHDDGGGGGEGDLLLTEGNRFLT